MGGNQSPRVPLLICATLTDLARRHTSLARADLECLHALVSDWQLLADLSFADLILWAPLSDGSGWMALAQMRPTTGPTSFQDRGRDESRTGGQRAAGHRAGRAPDLARE